MQVMESFLSATPGLLRERSGPCIQGITLKRWSLTFKKPNRFSRIALILESVLDLDRRVLNWRYEYVRA